jgi:hypothetical protein
LAINDPYLSIDFDLAVAAIGFKEDLREIENQKRRSGPNNTEDDFWRTVNKVRAMKNLQPVKIPIRNRNG